MTAYLRVRKYVRSKRVADVAGLYHDNYATHMNQVDAASLTDYLANGQ